MKLDRAAVVRSDFARTPDGYDRAAVDAHLEEIAAAIERGDALGESVSTEVQGIVSAAQRAADQIEREARARAARLAGDAERTAQRAQLNTEKLDRISMELDASFGRLRALVREDPDLARQDTVVAKALRDDEAPAADPIAGDSQRASAAPAREPVPTQSVELTGAEMLEPAGDPEPGDPGRGDPPGDLAGKSDGTTGAERGVARAIEKPERDHASAPSGSPGESRAGSTEQEDRGSRAEAARIVALDLALSGSSRDEIDRHLAEHFQLPDHGTLVDEVLAAVRGEK